MLIEALKLLIENTYFYITIIIIIFSLYYIIFKKDKLKIIDPFTIIVLINIFSIATVIFSLRYNLLDKEISNYILSSHILFVLGYKIIKPTKEKNQIKVDYINFGMIKFYYDVVKWYIVVMEILQYKLNNGFLLMKISRYGHGISGLGPLIRLNDFIKLFIIVYFSVFTFKNKKIKKREYIFLFLVILSYLLSGERAKILLVGFIPHILLIFYSKFDLYLIHKKKVIFLFSIFLFIFVTNHYLKTENINTIIRAFTFRIFKSGEIYLDGFYIQKELETGGFFTYTFRDLLNFLRVLSYSENVSPIGVQITKLIYGKDQISGANLLFNFYGYIFFGKKGGMIFSFILGIIIGYVRKRLVHIKKNFINILIYVNIYLAVVYYSILDLSSSFSIILNALLSGIVSIPIIIVYFILKIRREKNEKDIHIIS